MGFQKDLNKFKPRKEQKEAIEFINNQYKENPTTKFFLLDLPVGTGKSHLSFMIADWYRKNVNGNTRLDIITNSKILQDQYSQTYESIADLKGKNNYQCKKYSCSCLQGAEFNQLNKTKCDECPYAEARDGFVNSGIALTNFYLYVLYAIHNPKILENRGSRVLIVDECHSFDDVISDFISVKITENMIKKYKFSSESEILQKLNDISSIDNYVSFLKYFSSHITNTIESMEENLSNVKRNETSDRRDLRISNLTNNTNKDVKKMNQVTDLTQLLSKITVFIKEYKDNPDNWVLESNYNKKTKKSELSLEPIWAYDYLDKYVFSNYQMVFLMSGTILNKQLFCKLNGLNVEKAAYYSIDSPFEKKNRPIYYMPIGKMSYRFKQDTFRKYIPYIKKILKKYHNSKGVIHTNSFELSNWIKESIKDPRLVFHDSDNKDEMLDMHKRSDKPVVLVSPSIYTGVSLNDSEARFQIIAKIPYPSLQSQKNKERKNKDKLWYAWKTSSSLQQACGRIVRSNTDYGDTIILDASFGDVLKYSSRLMPRWFKDAIKKVSVKN